MNRTQLIKWLVLIVIVFVFVSLWWQGQRPQAVTPVSHVKCEPLKRNCTVQIGHGELQWFVEKPIQYLKPFENIIHLNKIAASDVRQISIEFVMQGMQMAANKSVFKNQSATSWNAQSVLPICASGRKDWLAIVRVETNQAVWQVGFEFRLPAN